MIVEQIYQTDRIATSENPIYRSALNELLLEICGGRRIYDLNLFTEAIRERMYWCFPVLSEIQEEHISL